MHKNTAHSTFIYKETCKKVIVEKGYYGLNFFHHSILLVLWTKKHNLWSYPGQNPGQQVHFARLHFHRPSVLSSQPQPLPSITGSTNFFWNRDPLQWLCNVPRPCKLTVYLNWINTNNFNISCVWRIAGM